MKPTTQVVVSLVTAVLLPFHVAGDVARGFDRGGPGLLIAVAIVLALVFGALVLGERRSGNVIMLLGGIGALAMPIIHRNNGFTPVVAASPGGLAFQWTLMALGVTGGMAVLLSAGALMRSR